MVPVPVGEDRIPRRFPRASGDGPLRQVKGMLDRLFPPRERGWSLPWNIVRADGLVSPARAGMVPCLRWLTDRSRGFPRASGDGPAPLSRLSWRRPFPPRERGWSQALAEVALHDTVSPARAGMVPGCWTCMPHRRSFPRASGDGPGPVVVQLVSPGFPPRERGWSPEGQDHVHQREVSPARAGMVR